MLADVDNAENLRFLNSGMGARPSSSNYAAMPYEYNKRSISVYLKQLSGADVTNDMERLRTMRGNIGEYVEFNSSVDNYVDDVVVHIDDAPPSVVDDVIELTVDDVIDISVLRNNASKNFDTYLNNFKNTGENVGLPYGRLTDDEWRILNDDLASDGIRLERYQEDGKSYMRFVDDTNHPAGAARVRARQANVLADDVADISRITGQSFTVKDGAYVSNDTFYKGAADAKIEQLRQQGYIAVKQGTIGTSQGEQYVIVAVRSDQAAQLGTFSNGRLFKQLDKTSQWTTAQRYANSQATLLNDADGLVQLVGVGKNSGRPVALVRVTKNGKSADIPFYVSSGTAGKTDVPTGKWEVFGGYSGNWFVKGDLESIVNHYNCPQLRKIANALDSNLGDLRDTEYVLETIGRASRGGQGNVANVTSNMVRDISTTEVNNGLSVIRNTVERDFGEGGLRNIHAIVRTLKDTFGWH